jgi:hypothetical protein
MARRLITALLVFLLGIAFVAPDVAPSFAQPRQQAQKQKKPRPGFFQKLFGPRQESSRPRVQGQTRWTWGRPDARELQSLGPVFGTARKKKKRPSIKEAPLPTVEVVEKDANARKVLVIGDFVAGGLAWGLDQQLANETRLVVIDKSNPASGLVRPDQYDWNATLLDLLNAEKPDAIVAVFGANDRQQIRDGNKRIATRSAEWEKAYAGRLDGVVETLKVYGRPFFWLSAPPMKASASSTDMAYLNGLYKPRVESAGGTFVDIWNGFTNASGQYITTGPDIEGQVRALRTSDGINFTRAGRLKLSFYVERDVRRKTGVSAGAVDLLASTSEESQIEIGPDGKKRLVGPVISLSDPRPGLSDALAGAPDPVTYDPLTGIATAPPARTPAAEAAGETLRYRVVIKGETLPAVAGRADDFAWPPRPRTAAALPAAEAPTNPSAAVVAPVPLTPVSRSN